MGHRATDVRPEPSATGTIDKRPVMHLLVYARDRALTGTLEIADPQGGVGTIVMGRGRVIKARADRAGAYLGSIAYELGLIDGSALDTTLRELSAGKLRHGEILFARGLLTREQLSAVLEEQVLRKLTHLHAMPPEATFAFYEGYDALPAWLNDGPHVDPLPAIWRGVRDSAPRAHVDAVLRRLGEASWRLVPNAQIAFFAFDSETAALVDLLRKPIRVADLLARAGGARPLGERLVYLLALTKAIEPVDVRPLESVAPASAGPVRADPSSRPVAAHASGTYARRISFELRAPRVGGAATIPPVSARSVTPPAASVATASVRPAPPEQTDRGPLTRAEIALRASRIGHESLYDVLGVDRRATGEEIRAAFFRLSQTWRPERLPPELADLRGMCSIVHARMEEAHQTLSNPEARARYDLMGASSRPPGGRVDAESIFREAEIALSRKDHVLAAELCKRAHELAPQEERYSATLVWIDSLSIEGDGKADLPELIARLDRIVRDAPQCESALFYRATFLKRIGQEDAAMRDFVRVVHLNPKHIEAVREVRLYNMRKGKRH